MKDQKSNRNQKDYTDEFRAQIAKLRLSGKSFAELARTYGGIAAEREKLGKDAYGYWEF